MPATNTAASRAATPRFESPCPTFSSSGSRIRSGTTTMSCTISIPTMTRPESVPKKPCSLSVLRTTAVLDREIMAPNHTDSNGPRPRKIPMP